MYVCFQHFRYIFRVIHEHLQNLAEKFTERLS